MRLLLRCLFFTLFAVTLSSVTTFAQTATVTTDKDDYSPGEYVIITGTGWQPGETVSFHFDETPKPATCVNSHDLVAVADAAGNIYNNQFLIKVNHIGVAFVLTATGQTSGLIATANFTDGNVRVKTNAGTISVEATFSNTSTCNTGTGLTTTGIGTSNPGTAVGVCSSRRRTTFR